MQRQRLRSRAVSMKAGVLSAPRTAPQCSMRRGYPYLARGRRAVLPAGVWLAVLAIIGVDVAQAQEGPFIYVPNLNGNDVTVIDTPTNTVAPATIPVGLVALAAAVRGDQSLVYVSNVGDNTVSVIDTSTNTVVATIPVGTGPTLIALSPDGTRAYVANQGSNDVTVINTATNTVVATIPVGNQADRRSQSLPMAHAFM